MKITEYITCHKAWEEFLTYKIENRHLSKTELKSIENFIREKKYMAVYEDILSGEFPKEYPVKRVVNKEGSNKKRVVYSFSDDVNIVLKFIAFRLYDYDDLFCPNCYAFRRGYGVRNAISKLSHDSRYQKRYCLKVDISNYFNSIDAELLLDKLAVIKERDRELYRFFENLLTADRSYYNGTLIVEKRGAMAGVPVSPFLANIYLSDVDRFFYENSSYGDYFRYSDDILIFGDNYDELQQKKELLYRRLQDKRLALNPDKVSFAAPGESWDFLGFGYVNGQFDLSANTKRKIKAKIKRKAEALRRWQRKKGLTSDKAAIGFIRAMNSKFYGCDDEDEFTWDRWFFPNLSVDCGLKEIDVYMQQYIRYVVTGRHYKGNYRISYSQLKQWGYRSLVHEYYNFRKKQSPDRHFEELGFVKPSQI